MSAIFLSHSSVDNLIAGEIAVYLASLGHRSLFLDFDPEQGIPAGRHWEQELYSQLRLCQAVIVLWSKHAAASKWVFAEITHAKALGKPLFPVRVDLCEVDPILTTTQTLDFTGQREEAYKRLARGLVEEAKLDARNAFDWDGSRPPFPGLLSFDSKDAAVFFGRDAEVQTGLDQLRSLQRLGGARVVLALGASGSGKSSLVKAGLIPNLQLDHDSWLVVPPFRPQPRLFPKTGPFKELALALSDSFKCFGKTRDWEGLRDTLAQAAEAIPARDGVLEDIAEDLRIGAGRREATVLLVIDQFEEVLTNSDPAEANNFLGLLRATFADPGAPVMVLCTLRSDFFQHFQLHAQLQNLAFEILSIPPMSTNQWPKIIEGPAAKSGIRLEPGLVDALVRDTEAEDALPLLAYTLRELWERFGKDGVLELKEYREGLGGLVGSIAKAAETVFKLQPLSAEQEADLRRTFSSLLVSVDAKGTFVQQTARWSDLPASVHDVLNEFVTKRLLVSRLQEGEREVEVAHVALFRAWERLKGWLRNERDFLLWRSGLRMRLAEWEKAGDADLLLRGVRLAEAQRWCEERSGELVQRERQFVEASRANQIAQEQRWQELYKSAMARQLAAQSELVRTQRSGLLQRSVLLAVESVRRSPSSEGAQALRRGAVLLPVPALAMDHQTAVETVAFDPRGGRLATKGRFEIHLWEIPSGTLTHTLNHDSVVWNIAFTRDGRLASASWDRTARIWDVDSGQELARMQHQEDVYSLAVSPDGAWLATTVGGSDVSESMEKCVWLWRCADGNKVSTLKHDGKVSAVVFSPDGRYLAAASWNDMVHVWEVPNGREVLRLAHSDSVMNLAFSPDGRSIATGCYTDGNVRVWDLVTGREHEDKRMHHGGGVLGIAFSPDGAYLATASSDRTARLWETSTFREMARMIHEAEVYRMSFHASGRYLVTTSRGFAARLWDVPSGREIARAVHEGEVNTAAFSPNGRYLATGGGNNPIAEHRGHLEGACARLWDLERGWIGSRVRHEGSMADMAFDPSGLYLASASWDGTARLWNPSTGHEVARLRHEGEKVSSLVFDPCGNYLATAGDDDKVVLWEIGSGQKIRTLPTGPVAAGGGGLAVSLDGLLLATGGLDKKAKVWEAATGQRVASLKHQDYVGAVSFSPDRRYLATGSANEVRVWEVQGGRAISQLPMESTIMDVAWSPDGRYLVVAAISNTAIVFDALSATPVAHLPHLNTVMQCIISSDGKYVATEGIDGVRVWEFPSGQAVFQSRVGSSIYGLNFTADGSHLGFACEDHTVRVYTVPAGEEVARIAHESSLHRICFSRDGRYLAASGADNSIEISIWRTDDLLAEACARLVRNLTFDEWREYFGDEPYNKTCPGLPIHESVLHHGLDLVAAGDLEGANRVLQRVIELDPEHAELPYLQTAIESSRIKSLSDTKLRSSSPD